MTFATSIEYRLQRIRATKLTLLALELKRFKPMRNLIAPADVEGPIVSLLVDVRHAAKLEFRGAKSRVI